MTDGRDIMSYRLPAALDVQRVVLSTLVSGEFLRNGGVELSVQEDLDSFIRDQLLVKLVARVRSHNLPPDKVVETSSIECAEPASWWQAWKKDVAAQTRGLRWIGRRWPVRMAVRRHELTVTVDLRRFHLYPDAPDDPRLGPAFRGHTLTAYPDWTERAHG